MCGVLPTQCLLDKHSYLSISLPGIWGFPLSCVGVWTVRFLEIMGYQFSRHAEGLWFFFPLPNDVIPGPFHEQQSKPQNFSLPSIYPLLSIQLG